MRLKSIKLHGLLVRKYRKECLRIIGLDLPEQQSVRGEARKMCKCIIAGHISLTCTEVLAKGDHIALGIANHRFSVEPWHRLDRSGSKPSSPKLSNITLQVIHEEREQSLPGAITVTDHV